MSELASHWPGFVAAYAILFFAASSPGPAVAMLLGIATGQGRAPALVTSAGIAIGSMTINVLTLLGVGLLLSQVAWAMTLVRFIGAAYLAWLAYGAFRKALDPAPVKAASVEPAPAWKHFIAGYLLQVTNVKAIIFWLAIAAVGATEGGSAFVIVSFVIGATLISFACHGAWGILLSSSPVRAAYGRARRWIEGVLGTFFAIFAFKLATERG